MPDNNTILRSSLARLIGNVFARQFTSTLCLGGVTKQVCLTELSEMDKLEIAGRDNTRSQGLMALAADFKNAKFTEGSACVLDGDPDWQVHHWNVSPDGATLTFTLIDGK